VEAWFYQHQGSSSSSSKRPLHGALRVLNIELSAAMPTAQLLEVQGVSHFGPLEKPEQLAASCEGFFMGGLLPGSKL
jgi:pimeloyl-ACP methyl ester carboxylesterase